MIKGIPPGKALDVGMGQGRNAIRLAQQGWDVTGFDPADKAVALAQETAKKLGVQLKTEIKGAEDFDFGDSRWDLILVSYAGGREMQGALQKALKPGGILIIERVPSRRDQREIDRRLGRVRYRRIAETLLGSPRRAVRRTCPQS